MANILVCDDDREIVDAIEIYLKQDGYRIFKAYDGEQAMDIMKKWPCSPDSGFPVKYSGGDWILPWLPAPAG